jgi:hypothetical protein
MTSRPGDPSLASHQNGRWRLARARVWRGLDGPGPVWIVCVAILVLRQPDALRHATFWGEDGWIWYPQAYADGWRALLQPHTGYLQTVSRLVALAIQPLPLAWAPTLFASVAIALQALPEAFLLSRRLDQAWPNMPARRLFALLYAALPNMFEVSANLTNAQWHLAVLAFLVLASTPARGWAGRAFDAVVLVLSGLSGPFCLFLLPVAVVTGWRDGTGQRRWRSAALAGCALIQAVCLVATADGARSAAPLGASLAGLARIVAVQIMLGPLLGARLGRHLVDTGLWAWDAVPILLAGGGLLLAALALRRGSPLLRLAAFAASALFAAALASPQVRLDEPQWLAMTRPGAGQRYYLVPMLVWIGMLLTLAAAPQRAPRLLARGLLCAACIGIVGDWHPPKMGRTDFVDRARAFAVAPPGTRAEFPLHPPGASPMVLVKRQP